MILEAFFEYHEDMIRLPAQGFFHIMLGIPAFLSFQFLLVAFLLKHGHLLDEEGPELGL